MPRRKSDDEVLRQYKAADQAMSEAWKHVVEESDKSPTSPDPANPNKRLIHLTEAYYEAKDNYDEKRRIFEEWAVRVDRDLRVVYPEAWVRVKRSKRAAGR